MPQLDPTRLLQSMGQGLEWAQDKYRQYVPSDIRRNISDIQDATAPGMPGPDDAIAGLAMVLNPKTINKFNSAFKSMQKILEGKGFKPEEAASLAFLHTRYTPAFKRMLNNHPNPGPELGIGGRIKNIFNNDIDFGAGAYTPGLGNIGLRPSSASDYIQKVQDTTNIAGHEIGHKLMYEFFGTPKNGNTTRAVAAANMNKATTKANAEYQDAMEEYKKAGVLGKMLYGRKLSKARAAYRKDPGEQMSNRIGDRAAEQFEKWLDLVAGPED